ncbi:hypothetical protein L210DRAFT_3561326 [Boletus edulis BED1]|uniref:Uncharacterized protein n=1 Tax=Boletus edulis BED1 TaxID=1328754 RepID=A0AAD4BHV6_BOLED|nr:hypothetical protein L210DRAFT_3593459 [Boletus edulis BED1]KAF8431001.1 hypothetical protein L210DRAFT_3561326 [Boletus edulis BED1]
MSMEIGPPCLSFYLSVHSIQCGILLPNDQAHLLSIDHKAKRNSIREIALTNASVLTIVCCASLWVTD